MPLAQALRLIRAAILATVSEAVGTDARSVGRLFAIHLFSTAARARGGSLQRLTAVTTNDAPTPAWIERHAADLYAIAPLVEGTCQ